MHPIHRPQQFAEILEYSLADIEAVVERIKITPRKVYYSYISRKIKNGKLKERPIDPSRADLRDIQNRIYVRILKKIPLPSYMMGSIKGRNNIDNAATHRGGLFNFQTDLKNFFGYVTNKMVFDMLKSYGFSNDVSHLMTKLCTYKGHLPQGAPTSAILANLVGITFDEPILAICREHKIKYTRYVDDLWVTADHVFSKVEPQLLEAITNNKFLYSHRKTFAKAGKIEGTGVRVHKGGRLGLTKKQQEKLASPDIAVKSKKGLESYKKQVEKR